MKHFVNHIAKFSMHSRRRECDSAETERSGVKKHGTGTMKHFSNHRKTLTHSLVENRNLFNSFRIGISRGGGSQGVAYRLTPVLVYVRSRWDRGRSKVYLLDLKITHEIGFIVLVACRVPCLSRRDQTSQRRVERQRHPAS